MHFSARFLVLIAVVGLSAIPFAESSLPAVRARTRSSTSTQQYVRRVDVRGLRKRDTKVKEKSGTNGQTPVDWMMHTPGKNPNAGNGSSIGPGGEDKSPFCEDLTSLVDLGKDPKFFTSTKFDGLGVDAIFDKFSAMCYKYLDAVAPDYNPDKAANFEPKTGRYPKKDEAGDAWPIPNHKQTYVGVCVAYKITSEDFWTSKESDAKKAAYLEYFKTPEETTLGFLKSIGAQQIEPIAGTCGINFASHA